MAYTNVQPAAFFDEGRFARSGDAHDGDVDLLDAIKSLSRRLSAWKR